MGKKSKAVLGNALIRNRNAPGRPGNSSKHTTDDAVAPSRPDLKSVTEETALNEFISTAELQNRDFIAERVSTTTIVTSSHIPGVLTEDELESVLKYQESNKEFINIPRRPFWDATTTPAQLELAERESFIYWRRELALLDEKDEKILLTPYEKNIDVWRQLWRVIERSDVICQIVDGRNPLLFKCDDLDKYVKEVDESKENLVLINKADYLNEKQRKYWAEYFEARNIKVVFWSALLASLKEQEDAKAALEAELRQDDVDSDSDSDEEEPEVIMDEEKRGCESSVKDSTDCTSSEKEMIIDDVSTKTPADSTPSAVNEDNVNCVNAMDDNSTATGEEGSSRYSILSRTELLEYFERFRNPAKDSTVIGMVGFPNVGKSSTLNALIGDKKTSVSATPGKTKHFQTINIDEKTCLCDCPGLVFPTFVSTKAAMILNGILPVDQLRDYRPPVTLLCKSIPRHVLENTYAVNIVRPGEAEDPNRTPTAEEFLSAYSSMRGFMTAHGLPDCSRGARHIIKDFLSGKLLYCEPPPNVAKEDFEPVGEVEVTLKGRKRIARQNIGSMMNDVDREFFTETEVGVHYNPPSGMRGMNTDSKADQITLKPWKKHFNRNKKEKIRRMFP